jgi:predicted transcriptional regulator
MSTKELLLEIAEKLPPNASLDDAISELEFRRAVQKGLAELDRGESVTIDELKSDLSKWVGK